jgi:ActR/RegA family two-component response regulator
MALSGAERQRRYIERLKAGASISFEPDTPDEEIARVLYERLPWEKIMRIAQAIDRLVKETKRAASVTKRTRKRPARKR